MPPRKPPVKSRSTPTTADLPHEALPQALPVFDEEEPLDEGAGAASPSAEPRRFEGVVGQDGQGVRLDQWLARQLPEFSRSHLQQIVGEGLVQVQGQVLAQPARRLQVGLRVKVELRLAPQDMAFVPEVMDLPIVFEDDHLLVVDKPVGLVVHPAPGNWTGTLMNGLLAHHPGAAALPRAGIVHRLDKDTSGLMVVGKTLEACTALVRAIAAREVHRQYAALVWGGVPPELTLDAPIGRDPVSRVRMAVVSSGKPARTDVRRVAMVPAGTLDEARAISAIECTLHTGRTHQIRVHLSHRGWPLLADAIYGGRPALGLTRQALHARRLAFEHPVLGGSLEFRADLPSDMGHAWDEVVHNGGAG